MSTTTRTTSVPLVWVTNDSHPHTRILARNAGSHTLRPLQADIDFSMKQTFVHWEMMKWNRTYFCINVWRAAATAAFFPSNTEIFSVIMLLNNKTDGANKFSRFEM